MGFRPVHRGRTADRRLVSLRRVLHQVGADHGEDEEEPRVYLPRRAPADAVDQLAGDRSEDAGAGGEDADRKAVDQAAVIRKPLRAHRDRREVAEAEADAHHHAPRQVQHGQRLRIAGEKQAGAIQQAADGRDRPGTDASLQESGEQERRRQHHHVDRRHERGLRPGPAELLFERRHVHAPRVVGAERDVQQTRRRPGRASGVASADLSNPYTTCL